MIIITLHHKSNNNNLLLITFMKMSYTMKTNILILYTYTTEHIHS